MKNSIVNFPVLQGACVNRTADTGKIAAAFHRKAAEYDQHVLVQKRVVAQLAGSINLHQGVAPEHILDVGTGTGTLLERLHGCYPQASLTGVDIALNMCLRAQQKLGPASTIVNADAECLPCASSAFDLVVSASALQWVGSISAALSEMYRVVRPGGTIAVAFFCDGTLTELQSCFRDATGNRTPEQSHKTGRLHGFRTVDEVRAILNEMDFERCVVTVETEVDWYDDLYALLRSIKNIGAGPVSGGKGSGLGWRGVLGETARLYQERYGVEGRIPATYNVLYIAARTRL